MKELPSNKEIAVTAFCVAALFLSGYICNIQEHRAVVADLRHTITELRTENIKNIKENIEYRANLLEQYTLRDLVCRKRVADLEKTVGNN